MYFNPQIKKAIIVLNHIEEPKLIEAQKEFQFRLFQANLVLSCRHLTNVV